MILLIATIYQLGGRSLFHTYFSHGLYVARIGVINNKGWLLTLSKPCRQNKHQHIGDNWSENCASSDDTHHDYEEIKERKSSTGHRYSYTQSKSITGSLLQTNNNNFHPVSHEGHFTYNCYEDVPLPPALIHHSLHHSRHHSRHHSPHHSHPIYSLTDSDIEKAVAPTALDKSRIVCYCFAICLAITFLVAIVMMISNIITKMYLRF